jgi:drug/metabolite transporter (DMT)-like permease
MSDHEVEVARAKDTPPENRRLAIAFMLATLFCFIVLDTIVKYALEFYPLVQVTWGRFFFATVFSVFLCLRDFPSLAISKVPGMQLIRSAALMTTTILFNLGVMREPLATATTIMFLSPIVVTLLSIVVLKEHVGLRRWIGILTGFCGAVIVVQPWEMTGSAFNVGALFLLAAAFCNGAYQIITRKVRADNPLTSLLFTAAAGALLSSLVLPWYWQWPDAWGWLLLISSGFAGALGHYFLIEAMRRAPASVVAPFSYSSLVWATMFGYIIWQELPTANVWIGAALIIAAGLYLYFRERVKKAEL